jgi:amino acid adenylation domain-containing protein
VAVIDQGHWLDSLEAQGNLTRSQFLIWTGQQLDPMLPVYNVVHAWRLQGPLDRARFSACFEQLVGETEALRLVVENRDGVPWQRVLQQVPQPLNMLDLAAEDQPEKAFRRWQSERSRCRLVLDRQLFDAALVRLSAEDHVWYLNQHHLICDAWSTALVCARMVELYAGRQPDGSAASPPLFTDYAARERQQRASPALERSRQYWQQVTAKPPLRSDFYGARVSNPGPRTHRVRRRLGQQRSAAVRALAASPAARMLNDELSQLRVFSALVSGLLARLSGFGNRAIGSPVHNRASAADKATPGLFIELFPLFIESRQGDSFTQLLERAGGGLMAWLSHARAGLSTPESNRHFDVVLNFLTARMPLFEGLETTNDWVHPGFGDRAHALRIQVHDFDDSGAWVVDFDFNRSVFDTDAEQRLIRQFFTLLDGVVANPDQPLEDIDLADPAEQAAQLEAFNHTKVDFDDRPSLMQAIGEHIQAQPDAIAMQCGEQALSYRALGARVAQASAELQAAGAGPGTIVALCMSRNIDAMVTLLAVLASGAAFLPLEPRQPQARLAAILADVAASEVPLVALVSDSGEFPSALAPGLRILGPATADAEATEGWPELSPPAPGQLAYLIYTSGSTGTPKGVQIPHRALHNYLHWAREQYCPGTAPTVAVHTSLAVDLTITSLFLPLLAAGKSLIYPDLGAQDLPVLRVIEEDAVDLLKLTPAHLALVRETGGQSQRIKTLVVGGELLNTDLARAVTQQFPKGARLFNEYGPTEATVGCMVHLFDPQADKRAAVPIGRPIANTRIYCLDADGRPAATGLVGELCVAGPGLALGYLGQERLTAERFGTAPRLGEECVYRTGDAARWLPDGELQLLGRVDRQVKVRGSRVEPGEVEAALNSYPGVQQSVVQLRAAVAEDELRWCTQCGMPSHYPGLVFDSSGVCSLCRAYERHGDQLDRFFGSPADLEAIVAGVRAAAQGSHDAIVLVSGGKDSTYMLHQLAGLGLNMLALTLDNGFLSEQAMDNAARSAAELGVEHLVVSTPHMNEIFADSLARHSNVCHGCFKTIYTLALQEAAERNIAAIFTGLSRGQIFETRLDEMFRQRQFDVRSMEQSILDARKVYHRMDDAVARRLDTALFDSDDIFEQVRFVDFYRYVDVPLDEVYRFLDQRAPWVRPTDTGRSTNCRINDAGIYVHRRERGFHNYALPYSWDVRLGHKTREAALHELNDDIDVRAVREILDTVGFVEKPVAAEARLLAWYQSEAPLPASALREHLASRLPEEMLPAQFVHVASMPLSPAGKVDIKALPAPADGVRETARFRAPGSELEQRIAAVWAEFLNEVRIGADDSFFDIGGRSLTAIQVLARLRADFGIELPMQTFFNAPTVAALADAVEAELDAELEALSDEELESLLANDQP